MKQIDPTAYANAVYNLKLCFVLQPALQTASCGGSFEDTYARVIEKGKNQLLVNRLGSNLPDARRKKKKRSTMAQKEAGVEQSRLKTGDCLGSKAVVGAPTAGGGVVVEVREKKGPLRAAIPTMPFPLAVICLFLNTFIPGLGTFISAFTVLCGARSDLVSERGKCCVFWLNVAAALIQIVTAVIMVGWIMSIFWGMDMVILAISDGCRDQGVPQDV